MSRITATFAKIWSLDEIPITPLYNHQHEQQEEGEDQEDIIDDEEQERRLSARYRRLFMLPLRKEVRVGSQASSSSSSSTSRRQATASSLHLNDKGRAVLPVSATVILWLALHE